MKKLSVFETSIIGFFVGVMVSAYLVFVTSNGWFVGKLLDWVSLLPVATALKISGNLVVSFLFFILVYTLYGAIAGLIIKTTKNSKGFLVLFTFIALMAGAEQQIGSMQQNTTIENTSSQTAAVATVKPTPAQYFGNEVLGDLNADGRDDVAFLISRADTAGTMYYLSAALAQGRGHAGAGILYVGSKIKPQVISITNGLIAVDYLVGSSNQMKHFYASVVDGTLVASTTSSR